MWFFFSITWVSARQGPCLSKCFHVQYGAALTPYSLTQGDRPSKWCTDKERREIEITREETKTDSDNKRRERDVERYEVRERDKERIRMVVRRRQIEKDKDAIRTSDTAENIEKKK